MNEEVKFKNDRYNYYNRAVGIIKNNNKFLIMNVDNADYYHIPGGHIEINEDSKTAISREIMEELGYTVKTAKLFCIQENFYEKKSISQHGVEYYYVITVEEKVDDSERNIVENDRGVEKHLYTKWVTAEELKNIDLKPFTVKQLIIENKLDDLVHLINRD